MGILDVIFNRKPDLSAYETSGRSAPIDEKDKQSKAYQALAEVAPYVWDSEKGESVSLIHKVEMPDGSMWYACEKPSVNILDKSISESADMDPPAPPDYYARVTCHKVEKAFDLYVAKGPDGRLAKYHYGETLTDGKTGPNSGRELSYPESEYRELKYDGVSIAPLTRDEVEQKILGNPKYAQFAKVLKLFFADTVEALAVHRETERRKLLRAHASALPKTLGYSIMYKLKRKPGAQKTARDKLADQLWKRRGAGR